VYSPGWGGLLSQTSPGRSGQLSQTPVLGEPDRDARIHQTPKSGIVLWELPHIDKGLWK